MSSSDEELLRRMHREFIDSYDEELELEDRSVDGLPDDVLPALRIAPAAAILLSRSLYWLSSHLF